MEPGALLAKHARFVGGLTAAQIGLLGHPTILLRCGGNSATASIAHPGSLSSAGTGTGLS
jgi:hypothetical protein